MPKFEECLQRLEVVVREIERGDLSLEDSLKLFEEGVVLSGSCQKELEAAEKKVEILLKQDGQMRAETFSESSEILS